MKLRLLVIPSCLFYLFATGLSAQPEAGDVYREFKKVPSSRAWRIIDPDALHSEAISLLPNPTINIVISDLEGAVKAEVEMDRWGGHAGTRDKRFRINNNDWIGVPEREKTKESMGVACYQYQDNPVVPIPLEHLVEGDNTLEGLCGGQGCFSLDYGQWGWNGIIIRIYYDSSKPHPTGQITYPQSGDTIEDYPLIQVSAESANSTVKSVDVIGYYDGIDVDGDGVYKEWQRKYNNTAIKSIIGTAEESPYELEWDTKYVPDQEPGEVKLLARIQDENGYFSVTDLVDNLTLQRNSVSVQMYKARYMPANFIVSGNTSKNAYNDIDSVYSFDSITDVAVHVRSWNGLGAYFWINGNKSSVGGQSHAFSQKTIDISPDFLKYGPNKIMFKSTTSAHGIEVLWPGPIIIARYNLDSTGATSRCDINGNGKSDLDDLIEFVLLSRREPSDGRLDWDSDGRFTIADVVAMLMDINGGTCPDTEGAVSLSSVRRTFEIKWEELDYLRETIDRLDLDSGERSYLEHKLDELSQSIELPRAAELSLDQNFPNPFNPSTSISFTIGSGGAEVSLNIYDIRGSLIRTLVDGFSEEGAHTVFWNGTNNQGKNVSSGVYVYRLKTKDQVHTRKMVLLK